MPVQSNLYLLSIGKLKLILTTLVLKFEKKSIGQPDDVSKNDYI